MRRDVSLPIALLIVAALLFPRQAAGCPFCSATEPTLAERRDAADVVVLAEPSDASQLKSPPRLVQCFKGCDLWNLTMPPSVGIERGLALVWGRKGLDSDLAWDTTAVDELAIGYFVRSPATSLPPAERLPYFLRYLESPDAVVATDAYAELGRAPFDAVAALADKLPQAKLRAWLSDASVPERRKGLYALLLGLATIDADRQANEAVLRERILASQGDLRWGFDGVVAGYLLLARDRGLKFVTDRFLDDPQAPRADVLHVVNALRFHHEWARSLKPADVAHAEARLLARSDFAAAVVTDLARWSDWDALPEVVAVLARWPDDRPLEHAAIGYLLLCPEPLAARELAKIRARSPQRVEAIERQLATRRSDR